jgi:hypothetical protein
MYYQMFEMPILWLIKWAEVQEFGKPKMEKKFRSRVGLNKSRFQVSKLIKRWERILGGSNHVSTQQEKFTESISECENA